MEKVCIGLWFVEALLSYYTLQPVKIRLKRSQGWSTTPLFKAKKASLQNFNTKHIIFCLLYGWHCRNHLQRHNNWRKPSNFEQTRIYNIIFKWLHHSNDCRHFGFLENLIPKNIDHGRLTQNRQLSFCISFFHSYLWEIGMHLFAMGCFLGYTNGIIWCRDISFLCALMIANSSLTIT